MNRVRPPADRETVPHLPRIVLHWLVALLTFVAFPLGLYMHDLALTPTKLRLFSYHKWLGITILALATLRVWARAVKPPAIAPPPAPEWRQRAAEAVHLLLSLLTVAVPLSGWMMSSAEGFQTVWLGVLPLPDLVGRSKELATVLTEVHKVLNFVTFGIVTVHVLAALRHQFVLRDGVLSRMLPPLR